jgi:L-2-hydroxyglutarate oxidase LhgO
VCSAVLVHLTLLNVVEQVVAFQRPHLPQPQRQQHMDIVCGVEFSSDGWHLATAGIRKQVG